MGPCHDSDRIVSVYDRRGPGFGQSVFSQKPTEQSENSLNFHFSQSINPCLSLRKHEILQKPHAQLYMSRA